MASDKVTAGTCKLPAVALERPKDGENGKDANTYRSKILQPLLDFMASAVLQEPLQARTPGELAGFMVRWLLLEQLKPPMQVIEPLLSWLDANPELLNGIRPKSPGSDAIDGPPMGSTLSMVSNLSQRKSASMLVPVLPSGRPDALSHRTSVGRASRIMLDEGLDEPPVPQLTIEETCQRLRKFKNFVSLSDQDLLEVAGNFEMRRYLSGETLLNFGEKGQNCLGCRLMMIEEGECRVSVLHNASTLKPGDVFGQQLWLSPHLPAEEMVVAWSSTPVLCLVPKLGWDDKALRRKLQKRRTKIQAKHARPGTPPPSQSPKKSGAPKRILRMSTPFTLGQDTLCEKLLDRDMDNEKNDDDRALILDGIRSSEILTHVLNLAEHEIETLVDFANSKTVPAGNKVIKEGDEGGEEGCSVFIVHDGVLECTGDDGIVRRLHNGDTFGEMGLIEGRYSETVVAVRHSVLWQLDKATFTKVKIQEFRQDREKHKQLLDGVPMLTKYLNGTEIDQLVGDLQQTYFAQGDYVLENGKVASGIHFLVEGTLKTNEGVEQGPGTHVGLDSLLAKESTVSAKVISLTCYTLCLTIGAIEDCLGGSFAEHMQTMDEEGDGDKMEPLNLRSRRERGHECTLADVAGAIPKDRLVRVGILGAGSFGLVSFEEDPTTEQTFALKALSKGHVVSQNMIPQVQNELTCWRAIDSPFWIKLFATYKDQQFLYFLTEVCLGGELFDVFQDSPSLYGRLDTAQFYAAGATLGLQALHEKLMIYRDLKAENILLDTKGYPKLADFGLAKFIGHGQTFTACGTPDFLAPEVLRLSGHNRGVDWWALGVVIFIMMSGVSPFDAEHVPKIYANIVKGFKKETFPSAFKSQLVSVISSLCRKKPQERLTMRDTGLQPLKTHSWFNGFAWDAMEQRTLTPPHIPRIRTVEEIKANSPKELPPVIPYDGDDSGWDREF